MKRVRRWVVLGLLWLLNCFGEDALRTILVQCIKQIFADLEELGGPSPENFNLLRYKYEMRLR
jgi:hypothetical protein